MIVGADKITQAAEKIAANIAESYEDGELVEIDEVLVVVAVHLGNAGEDAESGSLFYRCTSARPHVQFGLVKQTERAIDRTLREEGEEEL